MSDSWYSMYGYPTIAEGHGNRVLPAPAGAASFPTAPEQVVLVLESVLPFHIHRSFRCSTNECVDGCWAVNIFNRVIFPVTPNQMHWLVKGGAAVGRTPVKWWCHPEWTTLKRLFTQRGYRELRWPIPSPARVYGGGQWRNHLRMAYNDGTHRGCFSPTDSFEAARTILERAWTVRGRCVGSARTETVRGRRLDGDWNVSGLCVYWE